MSSSGSFKLLIYDGAQDFYLTDYLQEESDYYPIYNIITVILIFHILRIKHRTVLL